MLNKTNRLRVSEIFFSLQGETSTVGLPTVFVRLTGCPLRCQYCDTAYAFHGGQILEIDDILTQVKTYTPRFVTVTGGEPLAQKPCLSLLSKLCDAGYQVSLETSGALSIAGVDDRVVTILDIKTPGSGEVSKNHWQNISLLKRSDQIKFVICDEADYLWAKKIMSEFSLGDQCEVLFSPSYQVMPAGKLADWILRDHLTVRLQIQLHKFLWGDVPSR